MIESRTTEMQKFSWRNLMFRYVALIALVLAGTAWVKPALDAGNVLSSSLLPIRTQLCLRRAGDALPHAFAFTRPEKPMRREDVRASRFSITTSLTRSTSGPPVFTQADIDRFKPQREKPRRCDLCAGPVRAVRDLQLVEQRRRTCPPMRASSSSWALISARTKPIATNARGWHRTERGGNKRYPAQAREERLAAPETGGQGRRGRSATRSTSAIRITWTACTSSPARTCSRLS